MRHRVLLVTLVLGVAASAAFGQSNISPSHKHAWAENVGWTNWRDANGGADGVFVDPSFLSGYIWGENVGWVNLNESDKFVAAQVSPRVPAVANWPLAALAALWLTAGVLAIRRRRLMSA